jgi:hypothetical protein
MLLDVEEINQLPRLSFHRRTTKIVARLKSWYDDSMMRKNARTGGCGAAQHYQASQFSAPTLAAM